MIPALCGFAGLLRDRGGHVSTAETIDAARALALTDLADRSAVKRALALTISWSAERPDVFDETFDAWFDGQDVDIAGLADTGPATGGPPDDTIELSTGTVEAARIHTDDALTVESQDSITTTSNDTLGSQRPATRPAAEGAEQPAEGGDLAPVPPHDDADPAATGDHLHDLPTDPPAAELELARRTLAAAVERRRSAAPHPTIATTRTVTTVVAPFSTDERTRLGRAVHLLDRRLDGAASWRRDRASRGDVDLRRTLRRTVCTAGTPIELRHVGRRPDGTGLVVLVDLSVSVRGTARLVLHLVHRLRTMQGSVRAFGFVDSCVPIDRALRVADPTVAVGKVFGLVDGNATSDPGAALRQWWATSHRVVTPRTHVMILGDGRCNGHDPAFEVVEHVTARSASTTWITPEPHGAWTLGRGEMAEYAARVDRAVTVRTLDDLERLTGTLRPDRSGHTRSPGVTSITHTSPLIAARASRRPSGDQRSATISESSAVDATG
jgi:uncharacterized protein